MWMRMWMRMSKRKEDESRGEVKMRYLKTAWPMRPGRGTSVPVQRRWLAHDMLIKTSRSALYDYLAATSLRENRCLPGDWSIQDEARHTEKRLRATLPEHNNARGQAIRSVVSMLKLARLQLAARRMRALQWPAAAAAAMLAMPFFDSVKSFHVAFLRVPEEADEARLLRRPKAGLFARPPLASA
jgi:hypothetical protein